MIIEVKKDGVFFPDYRNNIKDFKDKNKKLHKKLPEGERIKVYHRYLYGNEREQYIYAKNPMVNKATGIVNSNVEYVQDLKGIAKALVTKIENYDVICEGETVKVDTIDKLYSTPGVAPLLIANIEAEVYLASPEVDDDFLPKP